MVFFLCTVHGDSTVSYLAATDTAAWNPGTPTHIKVLVRVMVGDLIYCFLSISSTCVDYMHRMGFVAWLVSAFSTMIFCIISISLRKC
jgi:hypothetical protein